MKTRGSESDKIGVVLFELCIQGLERVVLVMMILKAHLIGCGVLGPIGAE